MKNKNGMSLKSETILSISLLAIAVLISALILKSSHHTQAIESIWVFLAKLTPYFFALVGIAYFPATKIKTPWNLISVMLGFGVMFCYFFPKQGYFFLKEDWEGFYLASQMLMPFTILMFALTMKMFGLNKKDTIVFGVITILFMLSGIEDLAFQMVNPNLETGEYFVISETWHWADHMTVFVGRVLSKNEAFLFIAIHFFIISIILYFSYSKSRVTENLNQSVRNIFARTA